MVLRRAVDPRQTLVVALSLFAAACASGDGSTPQSPVDETPGIEHVRITEKNDAQVGGSELEKAAIDYVRTYDSSLRLTDRDDFIVKKTTLGADKFSHVRLQQTYKGIPVWGADLVVHSTENRFLGLNGTLAVYLPEFDIEPSVTADKAMATGKEIYRSLGKSGDLAGLAYDRENVRLIVYPRSGRDATLAWHVQFFTELQEGINPGLWNYFIDAHSGDVLHSYNGIHTLEQASGPGGNPKVSRTWTDALDVEPQGGTYVAETAQLVTIDMQNGTSGGVVASGPLDNFGDAAINDAHGFAEQTFNTMLEWYGHNSLDDNGFVLRSRVHYSTNYENAFWDGTQMTYGDGASFFYPLSGDVDVVAHEMAHGYTTFHSDLIYSGESGGMNESFSDINGTITEHYSEGDDADWDVGTDIFQEEGAALRYMCDPTADGVSIDHYSDYAGQDVHYTSGIGNKAFCLAARRFSSGGGTDTEANTEGTRRVGEAFYEANASYWTSSSTYPESCQGTMDAAAALGFSEQELEWLTLSWQDVGVFCDGAVEPIVCDETLTAESGTITSPNYPNPYPDNHSHIICIEPASGQPATLTFTDFNTEAGYDFVTIKDANGTQLSSTSGTTPPPDATSTLLAVKFTSDGSVTATGWSANWSTDGTSNNPPSVSITEPADGSSVSGDVVVAADASDSDGSVARVTFGLPDGSTVDDDSAPYEVAWDSSTVADGSHVITATAFDDMGASSEASVAVTVENGTECVNGTFSSSDTPRAIPDNNTVGIRSYVQVSGAGNIGSISLSMNLTHSYVGDIKAVLVAPSGETRYVVHNRQGGSADNIVIEDLPLGVFDGEAAAGQWRLRVIDLAAVDTGTLESWSLNIVGDCDGGGGKGGASDEPNLPLVDNGQVCTDLTVSGSGLNASAIKLDVRGVHDWREILRGTIAHNGTVVDAFPIGTFPAEAGAFEFSSRPIAGLTGSAEGTWTLCIIDTDGYGDTGMLNYWALHE